MIKNSNYYTENLTIQLSNDSLFCSHLAKIAKSNDNEQTKKEKIMGLLAHVREGLEMLINCSMIAQLNNTKYIKTLDISCMVNALKNEIDYNHIFNKLWDDIQNY